MKDLIKQQEEYAEEFGYLHNDDCPINMTSSGECDCENLIQIKHIISKVRKETAEYVIDEIADNNGWKAIRKYYKQNILKEFNIGGKQNETRTQRSANLSE